MRIDFKDGHADIERLLEARTAPELSEEFRQRTLDAARQAGDECVAEVRSSSRWLTAAAVAAGVFLWFNLVFASTRHADLLGFRGPVSLNSRAVPTASANTKAGMAVLGSLARRGLVPAPESDNDRS